jgi:hypothetical protein
MFRQALLVDDVDPRSCGEQPGDLDYIRPGHPGAAEPLDACEIG